MRTLVWFRNDLRTTDNTALVRACAPPDHAVLGLFVVSPDEWRRHDWAACKVDLVLRTLAQLSADLARLNIALVFRTAERASDVPALVHQVCVEHRCTSLHFNREYEVNESRRDQAVTSLLEADGVGVSAHHDQTALPPGDVRTQSDTPFTVFTPFKKRWLAVAAERGGITVQPAVRKRPEMLSRPDEPPRAAGTFHSTVPSELWPAGEREARRRLDAFCSRRITGYKIDRDFPALGATSTLSPYLAIGAVSPRQCLAAAAAANHGRLEDGNEGAACWISEVIWREFYKHILAAFPRVCMNRAFKPATDRIPWSYDRAHFDAWATGHTGVPIVDAAMRCLAATGWMHNRLRMISAMFLTKDLFIDWRWGERHFMQHLVDGDLSQNNGGWQWSASTGTDAAPYFRIFNPFSQSARFDPRGEFIRRWVPELAGVDDESIHDPRTLPPLRRAALDYPEPIVDHDQARARVLHAFKALQP